MRSIVGAVAGILLAGLVPPPAAGAVRVLVVGDSWADLMWAFDSLDTVFVAEGYPEIEADGASTTVSGSTAAEWATPASLQVVATAMAAHPELEVVQISVGGNDVLDGQPGGGWYVGMPPAEEQALLARIAGDVGTLVDHVLAADPDVEVLLSLYDYPNFVESLSGPVLGSTCTSRWQGLGEPTPLQVNTALVALVDAVAGALTADPRVSWVPHQGLMQYAFGYPSQGIPRGTLLPPGDATLPSPPQAMLLGAVLGPDCIHLSEAGYLALAQNLWAGYYRFRFAGIFASGFESGGVGEWSSATGT